MASIRGDDPVAVALVDAIRRGDMPALRHMLDDRPELARTSVDDGGGMLRSALHIVSDWPGHLPAGAEMVALFVAAGADVNARARGSHGETPLHWAASSDDVEVLDALLDAGADIDASGAVIAGGTPLDDATAFAQWNAARRLVDRGARVNAFAAASLGLIDELRRIFPPDERAAAGAASVDDALWAACHGGQRAAAAYLLDRGAVLDHRPAWEPLTPLDAAARGHHDDLVAWLRSRGARSAAEPARSDRVDAVDDLTLRPATARDADEIADLVRRAYRDRSGTGWTTESHLLADERIGADEVRAKIARPDAAVLIARGRGGDLVACCEVVARADGLAYFGMFAVSPTRQAAGIGRTVLAAAETLARDRWRATRMEMTVIAQRQDLIAWYERRGYRRTGERRPFPYGDLVEGAALRDDLYFTVLTKELAGAPER